MRKYFLQGLVVFFISTLVWVACKKEVEESPFLTIEKKTVSFAKEASSVSFEVKTNIQNWMLDLPREDSWVTAKKEGNMIKLSVTENTEPKPRTTVLKVRGNDIVEEVKIQQLGKEPVILPDKESFKLEKIANEVTLTVTSNVKFKMLLPE